MRLTILLGITLLSLISSSFTYKERVEGLKVFTSSDNEAYLVQDPDVPIYSILKRPNYPDVTYSCSMGNAPIVIWDLAPGETFDSAVSLKPIYVEKGYEAGELTVESNIKDDKVDVEKIHISVQNPANGGVSSFIAREKTFYANTLLFAPPKSDFTKKIVFGFEAYSVLEDPDNQSELYSLFPTPQTVGHSGIFIFEYTNYVTFTYYAWDQLFRWNDYYFTESQKMYLDFATTKQDKLNSERLFSNGFYFCGGDEEPAVRKGIKNPKSQVFTDNFE